MKNSKQVTGNFTFSFDGHDLRIEKNKTGAKPSSVKQKKFDINTMKEIKIPSFKNKHENATKDITITTHEL